MNAMEDTATDLRATSDALMRDLEVLAAIEEEKRTLAPGDPRLVELAKRVEDVARRVLSSTVRQRQLTQVGNEQVEAAEPGSPVTSIDETPRAIADILAAWRAAERRATAAEPGSAEAAEARALGDHHREEYRRALEERETSS
jgi:DNA-binding HxlR family transcriptional regulator